MLFFNSLKNLHFFKIERRNGENQKVSNWIENWSEIVIILLSLTYNPCNSFFHLKKNYHSFFKIERNTGAKYDVSNWWIDRTHVIYFLTDSHIIIIEFISVFFFLIFCVTKIINFYYYTFFTVNLVAVGRVQIMLV